MKPWIVHKSDIYFTTLEIPGKPSSRDRQVIIVLNGIPYIQMTSEGLLRTSEKGKKRQEEGRNGVLTKS